MENSAVPSKPVGLAGVAGSLEWLGTETVSTLYSGEESHSKLCPTVKQPWPGKSNEVCILSDYHMNHPADPQGPLASRTGYSRFSNCHLL